MTELKEAMVRDAWWMFPHSHAIKTSGGNWRCGPAHEYLSFVLAHKMTLGNARIVVHMPPGHGKSTFMSHHVPLWRYRMAPLSRIGFATHSDDYASYWGQKLVDALSSGNPYLSTSVRGRNVASKNFTTMQGGEWTARGVGAGIMGRRFTDLILDDPIGNAEQAFSKKERKKLLAWFDGVAESRLEPDANIILLMQRWHEDDISSTLIKRGYQYISFPAIAKEKDELGRKIGEALWPWKWPIEKLLRKKDGDQKANPPVRGLSEYFWSAQWQGDPTPMGGRLIKTEWFRRWKILPERFDEECIFADLNMKEKKDGEEEEESTLDFTVFQHWGRRGSCYYLTDQVRGIMGITEQVKQFLNFCKKHPGTTTKGIEDKANGLALAEMVCRKVPGVITIPPKGGKGVRVMACEGVLKAGNVFLPMNEQEHPWVPAFIDECRVFSGGDQNDHDDQVDTMSLALIHFQGSEVDDINTFLSGWTRQ